jgi:hypothetical protein
MANIVPTEILSHWNHLVEGMSLSSQEFYSSVERLLGAHTLEKTKAERVNLSEGGLFSSKREYLQIRRGEHVFHVCAAPFGNGFFISWWLGHIESGLWALLARIPVVGFFVRNVLKPLTYYKLDTALMFQSVTHGAVLAALDQATTLKGARALSELDRKPIMRDFFQRIGA